MLNGAECNVTQDFFFILFQIKGNKYLLISPE